MNELVRKKSGSDWNRASFIHSWHYFMIPEQLWLLWWFQRRHKCYIWCRRKISQHLYLNQIIALSANSSIPFDLRKQYLISVFFVFSWLFLANGRPRFYGSEKTISHPFFHPSLAPLTPRLANCWFKLHYVTTHPPFAQLLKQSSAIFFSCKDAKMVACFFSASQFRRYLAPNFSKLDCCKELWKAMLALDKSEREIRTKFKSLC